MKTKGLSLLLSGLIIAPSVLVSVPSSRASFEPYQETFIVTAYYSPIEGQDFYVTGSLESDKRLNGNGTNGADGTPVYPGMIAAPGTYSFGTRVSCPGYIDGEIHDRGGAIVKAGQRNNAHDRLDFWAGQGDEALKTALYWGKRTLNCTVYPPGYSGNFQQYVQLPEAPIKYSSIPKVSQSTKISSPSPSSDIIPQRYQQLLTELGYDPNDKSSRSAFQIRHHVIDSPSDSDAGRVGPGTKSKLEAIFMEIEKKTPIINLKFGDIDNNVRTLQKLLAELGYLNVDPTAIFGEKTEEALKRFQLDQQIIENEDHPAAGYLGPETYDALKKRVKAPYIMSEEDRSLVAELNKDKISAEAIAKANILAKDTPEAATEDSDEIYQLLESLSEEWIKEHSPAPEEGAQTSRNIRLASASTEENHELSSLKEKLSPVMNPFKKKMSLGSKGSEVRKMQTLLKNLGFFEGEMITDYFGPQTKKAVISFQTHYSIISSSWSSDAGIIGPKTLEALNASYYQQEFSLPYEIGQSFRAPAINPEDLKPVLQQASLSPPEKS